MSCIRIFHQKATFEFHLIPGRQRRPKSPLATGNRTRLDFPSAVFPLHHRPIRIFQTANPKSSPVSFWQSPRTLDLESTKRFFVACKALTPTSAPPQQKRRPLPLLRQLRPGRDLRLGRAELLHPLEREPRREQQVERGPDRAVLLDDPLAQPVDLRGPSPGSGRPAKSGALARRWTSRGWWAPCRSGARPRTQMARPAPGRGGRSRAGGSRSRHSAGRASCRPDRRRLPAAPSSPGRRPHR